MLDASPLILFARVRQLDLIERLVPTILIPNAVIQEECRRMNVKGIELRLPRDGAIAGTVFDGDGAFRGTGAFRSCRRHRAAARASRRWSVSFPNAPLAGC